MKKKGASKSMVIGHSMVRKMIIKEGLLKRERKYLYGVPRKTRYRLINLNHAPKNEILIMHYIYLISVIQKYQTKPNFPIKKLFGSE